MKEYINYKSMITFREYLTMLTYIYIKILNDFNKVAESIENTLIKYKIEDVEIINEINTNDRLQSYIHLKNIDNNDVISINMFFWHLREFREKYEDSEDAKSIYRQFNKKTIDSLGLLLDKIKAFLTQNLSSKITLTDGTFNFNAMINHSQGIFFKPNSLNSGLFLKIYIKSKSKIDTFYYDFKERRLGQINSNGYFIPLTQNLEERLLNTLDTMSISIDSAFKKMVYILDENLVSLKNGEKNWISSLIHGPTHYELDFGDSAEKEVDFLDCIAGDTTTEFIENKEYIYDNIKTILTNLKESKTKLDYGSKIKISNELFFSSITPEKKEINSFFKDPDVLINCDLSKIDFKNADVRGMDLSGMDIKIMLSELYEKSIEGTNLRGVILAGQTLDGIKANNADLRDTFVTVYIENTSIQGTKFSNTTPFYLNVRLLDEEVVKRMGIILEEEQQEVKLALTR